MSNRGRENIHVRIYDREVTDDWFVCLGLFVHVRKQT